MGQVAGVLLLVALMLSGCQNNSTTRVVSSPYADGTRHTEPVFFNGKHYAVAFRFNATANAYDVNVAGKGGRKLGGDPGDRKIVEEIASSAVRHFACPSGQKAHIVSGTSRHTGRSWDMAAACL